MKKLIWNWNRLGASYVRVFIPHRHWNYLITEILYKIEYHVPAPWAIEVDAAALAGFEAGGITMYLAQRSEWPFMTPTMISEIVRGLLMTSFFFLLGPTICVSSFFDCANLEKWMSIIRNVSEPLQTHVNRRKDTYSRNLRTCSRANCELNTRSYKAFTPAYSWITR